jgi:hydrogenase large subunit
VTGLEFEPLTRVGGAVGLSVGISDGRYAAAKVSTRFFRGYENILTGRDLRDAIFTASRCCGYHGGQHAIASAQALEMALGLEPPPMAVVVRNLGLSAETIHAEAAHLLVLAGSDFSERTIRAAFPDLWAEAERQEAPNAQIHGLATIGEIMYSLNAPDGRWYREALQVARVPYQMYAIIHGKYPHPQTIVPGGVATTVTTTAVHDYLLRLLSLVDPAKRAALTVVDLLDFLVDRVPELARVGQRPPDLIDTGQWDAPEGYDPSWEGLSERGRRRWAAPGVIVDAELLSDDLREIADGLDESVENSFYADAGGSPWERATTPRPGPSSSGGPYSWSTTVRWKGRLLETGPGARLWATVLRGSIPDNPFITVSDGAIQMDLPQSALPRVVLEWRPPAVWNAVERNRARLYAIVFAALVAANNVLTVFDLQRAGRTSTETGVRNRIVGKGRRRGVGFAGDGLLGHWLRLDGQRVDGYQVIAPSTINLGPHGPAEEAINGSPILTDTPTGLEAAITLRSFDPCGNCASH